ncbi:MAG: hypothetical protein GC138_06520 [Gammaproteobacteria bacterium]|nr:hypothetical protein [Gammaproteobacteria bacterium]
MDDRLDAQSVRLNDDPTRWASTKPYIYLRAYVRDGMDLSLKKFVIALYAGLAITIWLIFLPPAEETEDNPLQPPQAHAPSATSEATDTHQSIRIAESAKTEETRLEAPVNPGSVQMNESNEMVTETHAENENPDSKARSGTLSVNRTHAIRRERDKEIVSLKKDSTVSPESITSERVTEFAFLPTATYTTTASIQEISNSSTDITTLARGSEQVPTQARQETTRDAGVDTSAATIDSRTTGDENAFLPQGDVSPDPSQYEQSTPAFSCPTSCYLKCTAYEINMLIKQGCPIPTQ